MENNYMPIESHLHDNDYAQYSPEMVRMFGFASGIIITQIHKWCNANKKNDFEHVKIDGYWWMYQSYSGWEKRTGILSNTVKKSIKKLSDHNVISYFNDPTINRGKNHYRINIEILEKAHKKWHEKGCPNGGKIWEILDEIASENDENQNNGSGGLNQPLEVSGGSNPPPTGGSNPPLKKKVVKGIKDSGEKISEKSEKTIDPYLQDDLLPETDMPDSENRWDKYRLLDWVKQKNGAGKNKVESFLDQLEAQKNYDGSIISALNLYESDMVYRKWCDLKYDELHGKWKDKSKPLGVEKTIELITADVEFKTYRDKGHQQYELEEEVGDDFPLVDDLWEDEE